MNGLGNICGRDRPVGELAEPLGRALRRAQRPEGGERWALSGSGLWGEMLPVGVGGTVGKRNVGEMLPVGVIGHWRWERNVGNVTEWRWRDEDEKG